MAFIIAGTDLLLLLIYLDYIFKDNIQIIENNSVIINNLVSNKIMNLFIIVNHVA